MVTRSTSRRSSTQRRRLIWARASNKTPISVALGTAGTFGILTAFQTALGADLVGATVMRIRGNLTILNSVGTGHSARLTCGIGVFATGTPAATIAPDTNPHLDWMWWKAYRFEPVAFATTDLAGANVEIDIRSKRKMEELNQDLVFAYENVQNVDAVQLGYGLSVLLALP